MARSVYDTFVPAGMPYITERKTNWVTTTVTAGQPRPQNLDPASVVISTVLAAASEFIDPSVIWVTALGYAVVGDMPPTRYKISDTPTTIPILNDAYILSSNGRVFINAESLINVRTLGGKVDGRDGLTGTIDALTLDRVTVTGANFLAGRDEGKAFWINLAGPDISSGGNIIKGLTTTIATVVSSTVVTLTAPATQAVTAQAVIWGTNDTDAYFKAVRAAATLGREAFSPAGLAIVQETIGKTSSNAFSNFKIGGVGPSSRIMLMPKDRSVAALTMMRFVGAFTPRLGANLTATPSAGIDWHIDIGSSTSLIPTDYIMIADLNNPLYSTDLEEPFGFEGNGQGEINRVRAVDSATRLALWGAVQYNYNASAVVGKESVIWEVSSVSNIRIHDLSLENVNGVDLLSSCIGCSRVQDMIIEGVRFSTNGGRAVSLSGGIDFTVDNCHFFNVSGPLDGDGTDGLTDKPGGYCMEIGGSFQNVNLTNCTGFRGRHMVTSGGGAEAAGKFLQVTNCTGKYFHITFDTHPNQQFVTFTNCHSIASPYLAEVDQIGIGFQGRADFTTYDNCSVTGAAKGLHVVVCKYTRIVGFRCWDCVFGLDIWNSVGVEVLDTQIWNPRSVGVRCWRYTIPTNYLISLGNLRLENVKVYGNPTIVQDAIAEQICGQACGFAFGSWTNDTPGTFFNQWEDRFTLINCAANDCDVQFLGPPSQVLYGREMPNNVAGESIDRDGATATLSVLTSGTMYCVKIELPKGVPITKVGTMFAAVPVAQTNLFMALLDKDRNVLGTTADQGAVAPSANVMTSYALNRTCKTGYAGLYYVGILQVAGTPSTIYGKALANAAIAGLAPIKAGASNTGLTTALPAISAATSTTSMVLEDNRYARKITTQSGKAFVPGMRVKIASNADPTKYMLGYVKLYTSTTLWVRADLIVGTGTIALWDITADATATAITANGNLPYAVALVA